MRSLFIACRDNDVKSVRALLDVCSSRGAKRQLVDARNDESETPLIVAATAGSKAVVYLLLGAIDDACYHAFSPFANVGAVGYATKTALYYACREGHIDIVRALIESRADVHKCKRCGDTPLIVASKRGHVDIVRLLLANGVAVNRRTGSKRTPLHAACNRGHLDVVQLLLEHGADVNHEATNHYTALDAAGRHGHLDVVRVLLEHGAAVNRAAPGENAPLHSASRAGRVDVVRFLLEHGARVDEPLGNNATPLYVACMKGHIDVARVLLERGADIDRAMKDGSTPLFIAAENGRLDTVHFLLARGARVHCTTIFRVSSFHALGDWDPRTRGMYERKDCETPLYAASRRGYAAVVRVLLDYGAAVDAVVANCTTPLHVACKHGHLDVVRALLRDDDAAGGPAIIRTSATPTASRIKHEVAQRRQCAGGADANLRAPGGETPLFTALTHKRADAAQYLLVRCVDANAATGSGKSLLFAAADVGYLDIVRGLLDRGAAVDAVTSERKTPLYIASERGHYDVVRVLLDHGADVNRRAADGSTPLFAASGSDHPDVVYLLVTHGADANIVRTTDGFAPLHIAAYYGRTNLDHVVRTLVLEGDADIDMTAANGTTPLFLVCAPFDLYRPTFESARMLLKCHADPNKAIVRVYTPSLPEDATRVYSTPLHEAVSRSAVALVRELIAFGASVDATDCHQMTPLALATLHRSDDVVQELLGSTVNYM